MRTVQVVEGIQIREDWVLLSVQNLEKTLCSGSSSQQSQNAGGWVSAEWGLKLFPTSPWPVVACKGNRSSSRHTPKTAEDVRL